MKIHSHAPVAKIVGDNVYVHRSALPESPIPRDVVEKREAKLPRNFDFQVVKWDRRSGAVSFIQSPDWDTAPEPIVGDSYRVDAHGHAAFRHYNPANPQIYHHKDEFVAPDYGGFNVAEAHAHAELWEKLHPDKTRIGYKKYWDAKVVPQLDGGFKPEETEIANRTARAHGAVGGKAIVPRYVEETAKPSERILDFGAGPEAAHTQRLRHDGFKHVDAFEFGSNVRPGVHNPRALQMEYDTVFASNVLNVQSSTDMMGKTLDELEHTVSAKGRLVANLPSEPRKMAIDATHLKAMLSERFYEVDRVGGTPSAPLFEARYPHDKYTVSPLTK